MTAAAAASEALRVSGVYKRFGSRQVLRGVDLDLRPGEILALVGENGSGKSTLVRCIAGSESTDGGSIQRNGRPLPSDAIGVGQRGVAVVWQDLALCDNLSAVANVFLGGERMGGVFLDEATMAAETSVLFARLGIHIPQPLVPVGQLSGGERQLVAIARAVRRRPAVLVLDEPTAALGVAESQVVDRVLAQLRETGTAILLVSHRLEQVFNLADRIAVLRDGRIVAAVSPLEVHPDDVVALISGIEVDSTARRQLRRLRSLVDQLAEIEPSASLPLIVSAMAEALGIDQLCVHLVDPPDEEGRVLLRRLAAVGLAEAFLERVARLPIGPGGGPPGIAAATGEVVVVEDVRKDRRWPMGENDGDAGTPRSTWSVPILGGYSVLGTISGYADTVGRPQGDQLELVSLYASHAAAAIDRERLLAEATRRNRVLETLRGLLDTLAGPQLAHGGLAVALLALCRGLGADAVAFHRGSGEPVAVTVTELDRDAGATAVARQGAAAVALLATLPRSPFSPGSPLSPDSSGSPNWAGLAVARAGEGRGDARDVTEDTLAVPIDAPDGPAVVTAWWADPGRRSDDAVDLLDDAARSLRLALERQVAERANAEAALLRRSQQRQREFLFRLNHELRTPLTAIQGYASTLRQPDVDWDLVSQQRFLDSIATESARMGRLVGDLLDFSAIDSGNLRLVPDWCDLGLVLEAARRCVTEAPASLFELRSVDVPAIWGDHDRLEQVFVNLFENAVRHAQGLTRVLVTASVAPSGAEVKVRITDDGRGPGLDPEERERVFRPHVRGRTDGPGAGLGLAIARGVVEAHGGTIALEAVAAGTSVLVTLPVEPDANESERGEATLPPATAVGVRPAVPGADRAADPAGVAGAAIVGDIAAAAP